MQSTSGPTPRILRVIAVTAQAIALGFLTTAQELPRSAIYGRDLVIGTTASVVDRAAHQPQGHHMSVDLSYFGEARVAQPPPPCGLRLAKHYRAALKKSFDVVELNTCSENDRAVDCPSEYLDTSQRLFLRLNYNHTAGKEMTLRLTAYRRDASGDTSEVQLPRSQKLAFTELWDELREIALCSAR